LAIHQQDWDHLRDASMAGSITAAIAISTAIAG